MAASSAFGLRRHFEDAVATENFKPDDVIAGREHIKAYVEFIHYVERLYEAVTTSADGHFVEPADSERRH